MKILFVVAAIVLALLVLYLIGGSVAGDTCISIGSRKACWSPVAKSYSGDLCAKEQCIAKPEDQQHNAIVGALLAACADAQANSYSDADLTKRIEDVTTQYFGASIQAQAVCEEPGRLLVRRSYG